MNRGWKDYENGATAASKAMESAVTTVAKVPQLKPAWRPAEPRILGSWNLETLSTNQRGIAFLKRMATAQYSSVGYPLSDKQREFARDLLQKLEEFMGQAV